MNKKDAAEFVGIGVRSLERYTSDGRISAQKVRTRSGQVADYKQEDLERLKAELFAEPVTVSPTSRQGPPPTDTDESANASPSIQDWSKSENSQQLATSPPIAGGTIVPYVPATITPLSAKISPPTVDPFVASIRLLLTVPEVALLTGLSEKRIKDALKSGALKGKLMGKWRIRRSDLEAYLETLFES